VGFGFSFEQLSGGRVIVSPHGLIEVFGFEGGSFYPLCFWGEFPEDFNVIGIFSIAKGMEVGGFFHFWWFLFWG